MEAYEKMEAKADDLIVEIGPHTVQTVEVALANAPKAK